MDRLRSCVWFRQEGICLLTVVLFAPAAFAQQRAATQADINQSVARGVAYLRSELPTLPAGRNTLAGMAILKANVPVTDAGIQAVLRGVLAKFESGRYVFGGPPIEGLYIAGMDAMFLMEAGGEQYQPQLQMIADYIVGLQNPEGAWVYPIPPAADNKSVGDTSVTQYACLGLWAAARCGVRVPNSVWQKTLDWHARHHNSDGGFAYNPGVTGPKGGEGFGASTLNMTVNGVGSMTLAVLHLAPGFSPLKDSSQRLETASTEPQRFEVLRELKVSADGSGAQGPVRIPQDAVSTIRDAYDWVRVRFRTENNETGYKAYYLYSLERMAALVDTNLIGEHDWYQECADTLLSQQQANGSWDMSVHINSQIDTAFAVLFLTRSTGKLLRRAVAIEGVGDGQMIGGRGLPDDLTQLDFNSRTVQPNSKPAEPLDKLLASLQNTGEINLEEVQEQIVQQIQLGDRERLVGQVNELLPLLKSPLPDVRRTAVWAVGRSDKLELAEHLIRALDDEDLGVMVEAQIALSWLSRKPTGFGLALDPVASLSPDATDQQKKQAIATWHREAVLKWGEWFLSVRPYADRGDDFESMLRLKMEGLKNAGG